LHNPPVLGEAGAVGADYQLRWLELVREYSTDAALGLLFAVMAVGAFSLVLFDRTDRVYLWIGAVLLLQAIYYGLFALDGWTENLTVVADTLIRNSLLFSLISAGSARPGSRMQRRCWRCYGLSPRLSARKCSLALCRMAWRRSLRSSRWW
jgi:hypothetical protein